MLPLCFMIRETQSGHVLKMQLESALPRKNPTFNERERGSAYLRAPYNEWLFVYEKRYKEGWGNEWEREREREEQGSREGVSTSIYSEAKD